MDFDRLVTTSAIWRWRRRQKAMFAAAWIERDADRPEVTAVPSDKTTATAPSTTEIDIPGATILAPLGVDSRRLYER